MAERIKYYVAESQRLVYLGECFADLFRDDRYSASNLRSAQDIVKEMQGRLALWNALLEDKEGSVKN